MILNHRPQILELINLFDWLAADEDLSLPILYPPLEGHALRLLPDNPQLVVF